MELERSYYGSPRWSWEILDCAMPMTFDTYSNCAHQCIYCFAYFQRAVGSSADDYLHHKVKAVNVDKVKRMFTDPDEHAGQFAWYIKQKRVMQWGGLSDGFDWYERKFRKSLELLRFFVEEKYPISISTKGVWWLYEDEYREVLEQGARDGTIHLKITVITDSNQDAKALEAGTPTPSERFDGLEEAAKMGVVTTLRFRPYILGVSDKCDVAMIQRAKSVGCYSVTTEFLCIEGRSSTVAAERYKRMSTVAGYDVYRFYRMNSSARSGLLRLNYDLKRPHITRMREAAEAVDLPFFVSDAHHKESGCTSGCCGLPNKGPLSNSFDGHFGEAIQIAKEKGVVHWSDISDEAENLKKISFYRAEGYNAGSTRARAKRRYQTMYDYMRETWNDVSSKLSPARHHGGAMVPTGEDENGDVIYTYNERWVKDGIRVTSVQEMLDTTGEANEQLDRLHAELTHREGGTGYLLLSGSKNRFSVPMRKWLPQVEVFVEPQEREKYETKQPGMKFMTLEKNDGGFGVLMNAMVEETLQRGERWFVFSDDDILSFSRRDKVGENFTKLYAGNAEAALVELIKQAEDGEFAQLAVSFSGHSWAAKEPLIEPTGAWGLHVTDARVIEEMGGYDESLMLFGDWEMSARLIQAGYRCGRTNLLTFEHRMASHKGGAWDLYKRKQFVKETAERVAAKYPNASRIVYVENHGQYEIRFNWKALQKEAATGG